MIEEIIENKLDYASLLCESDPNINLVENYLRDGRLFAYFEKQIPVAFIAVKEINDTTLEIKNLLTLESQKEIKVCDRATLFNLLIGLNGYTICSGVINEQLNGKDIIAVPLDVNDFMEIGYITHNKAILSRFGQLYIDILREYTKKDS